jgi:hypothetical protein
VISLFFLLAFRLPHAFEPVFSNSAAGAFSIIRKVSKGGSFGDLSLFVSPVLVLDIPAGSGSPALKLVLVFAHFPFLLALFF